MHFQSLRLGAHGPNTPPPPLGSALSSHILTHLLQIDTFSTGIGTRQDFDSAGTLFDRCVVWDELIYTQLLQWMSAQKEDGARYAVVACACATEFCSMKSSRLATCTCLQTWGRAVPGTRSPTQPGFTGQRCNCSLHWVLYQWNDSKEYARFIECCASWSKPLHRNRASRYLVPVVLYPLTCLPWFEGCCLRSALASQNRLPLRTEPATEGCEEIQDMPHNVILL